jgi:hypothetical protein
MKTTEDLKTDAQQLIYDFTKIKTIIDSCKTGAEHLNQKLDPLNSRLTNIQQSLNHMLKTTLQHFNQQLAYNLTGIRPYNYSREVGKMLANIFSMRASGGNVAVGTPYIIGERGPELFVPSTSGNIMSNNQLSPKASMRPINVVMNINTTDSESFRHSQNQILAETARALRHASRNL